MGETTYPGHGLGEDEIAAMASAAWHDHGEIPLDVAETIVESVLRAAWYQGYSLRNDNEISRLTEENERLRGLVRSAYNEGFTEGMREYRTYSGGKPWDESRARSALSKGEG